MWFHLHGSLGFQVGGVGPGRGFLRVRASGVHMGLFSLEFRVEGSGFRIQGSLGRRCRPSR